MLIERFYLNCLAHASYLVGDESSKIAAIIDPQRDIEIYLKAAEAKGLTIKYALLTHFHADFVAGHLELQESVGAQVVLGSKAKAEFPSMPLGDDQVIEFGSVRLSALQTPGHTPDAISILAFDLALSPDKPVAVFSGDTLFIGDVGRPDLLGSLGFKPTDLAEMLYDSIERLKLLPDDTLVYPAHGAGSLCGKALGTEPVSTIGQQKKLNYAMQPMSKQAFVAMVLADQPFAPAYFVHDAIMNRKNHPTLAESLQSAQRPLTLTDVLQAQTAGAQIIDTRDPNEFAKNHLRGAINVGIDGMFATWAGSVLKADVPIVVIATPGRENESIMRLGRIGFDQVRGYLEGGHAALQSAPDKTQSFSRISASDVDEITEPHLLLDVRSASERADGSIEGSLHIPLNELPQRYHEVPRDKRVVVHCAGGYRSSVAASILQQHGLNDVSDIVGGFKAWAACHSINTARCEK
jgi:glyoxylase-like metal-dependent hydrolase (beta-lactamase superfamily II)/rhodanese-related sulfurtransferase